MADVSLRRSIVPSLAFLVAVVAAQACSGGGYGSGTPTPQCTPPPAFTLNYSIAGVNATAFAGKIAALRLADGLGAPFACGTSMIAAGGSFTAAGSAFGPLGGTHLELVLNSGAGATFGAGDRHYSFYSGTAGTITGDSCAISRDWTIGFDETTAIESPVLWTPGIACPGQ